MILESDSTYAVKKAVITILSNTEVISSKLVTITLRDITVDRKSDKIIARFLYQLKLPIKFGNLQLSIDASMYGEAEFQKINDKWYFKSLKTQILGREPIVKVSEE